MAELRAGAALVARRGTDDDDARLRCIGFDEVGVADTLAFMRVRAREEMCSASHVALHVSYIDASAAFFSLLGFAPARSFTSNGACTKNEWSCHVCCDLTQRHSATRLRDGMRVH